MTADSIPGTTSSSFVELVKQRDAEAWKRLSSLYGPMVYRWARQAGLQESDAADLTQEVFLVVAQQVQEFDKRRGTKFRAWLWGITRNKLREWHRLHAAHPLAAGGSSAHQFWLELPDAPPPETGSKAPFDEEAALLHRALELIRADFADHTWEAFWRAVVNGERSETIPKTLA